MSSESPLGSDYASSEQLATTSQQGTNNGQDQETDNETGNNNAATSGAAGGKKRASSGGGRSRAVSNLTQEQLARKRAHDRDAQRAIRLRTRTHIQSLEEKTNELESENGDLRRRLESILRMLENLLREGMAQDPRIPHNVTGGDPNGQIPPYLYQQICRLIELASPPPSEAGAGRTDSISSDRTMTGVESPHGPQSQNPGSNSMSPIEEDSIPTERLSLDFVLQDQKMPPPSHVVSSPNSSEASSVSLTRHQSQQSNHPFSPPHPPSIMSHTPPMNPAIMHHSPHSVGDRPQRSFQINAEAHWEALPRHMPETCPLDRLYYGFLEEQMRMHTHHGVSLEDLIGPDTVDVTHIVYPDSQRPTHTLSQMLSNLLRTYEKIVPLPERLAIFYLLYVWFRWVLHPTKHTYAGIPEFFRPRPLALFTPHPIWMDHVPFPLCRDAMHSDPAAFPNPEWSLPYTRTVSVSWPYTPHECIVQSSNGDLVLHPVFEAHIRNFDNWSVGPEFMEAFPNLVGTMKVKAMRQDKVGSVVIT